MGIQKGQKMENQKILNKLMTNEIFNLKKNQRITNEELNILNKKIKEIEKIKEEINVIKILNQIEHAISGLRYEESKKITCATMNNQKASIEVKINNETIAAYKFYKD